MTLEFKVAEGEFAACTIMEQAAAIWKHYNFDVDKVEELIDYLKVAINGEDTRQRNRIEPVRYETSYQSVTNCHGPIRTYGRRRVYAEDEEI